MPSVLVIEDDAAIRQALAERLAGSGFQVSAARSGLEGVEQAANERFDVVVLDLGLPDVDGFDVLRMLRGLGDVPVIVATARDEEKEVVRLLEAGADDYVIKPFSATQIEARIKAVLRRTMDTQTPSSIRIGELIIDLEGHEARMGDRALDLTAREFELLTYLAERPGVMVSKRELMAEVWRQPYGGADKTVDVHVSWLRKKLGETAAEPRFLHTRRGVGVKLVDPGQ